MNDRSRATSVPTSEDPAQAFRFERTVEFLHEALPPPARLLDLGARNPLGGRLEETGYTVINTSGDLDLVVDSVARDDVEAVTAFEILEHLVAPFNVLRAVRAPRLFATVPMRLWFASAYRNPDDAWDRHYHEFEPWQFDWLLEKSGWEIVRSEQWIPRGGMPLGIRPLLRRFTPRWYAVEAVRRSA
jgi:hypothetical protein